MVSYGAIARMLEHPHAARTVGWALHSLPPSVPPASGGEERGGVPWWRVLNSKGRISLSGERGANLQHTLTVSFMTAALGGSEQVRITAADGSPQTITVKIPPGIDSGEKLIKALGAEPGKGTERLRKSTKRMVRHLKEELTRWEDKYKKARLDI